MTWEQKFEAIIALAGWYETSIKMRKPGDWYTQVSRVDIQTEPGGCIIQGCGGSGKTPQEAVERTWQVLVEASREGRYIKVRDVEGNVRHVAWAGFMWKDIPR